jgi:hypothetical protein
MQTGLPLSTFNFQLSPFNYFIPCPFHFVLEKQVCVHQKAIWYNRFGNAFFKVHICIVNSGYQKKVSLYVNNKTGEQYTLNIEPDCRQAEQPNIEQQNMEQLNS